MSRTFMIIASTSILMLSIGLAYVLLQRNPMKTNEFDTLIYPYTLPELGYAYDALEPHIDQETMNIHHTKHHQAYIDNLNKALITHPDLQQKTLEELLKAIPSLPESVRTQVRNHGGGHYNHSFFWKILAPGGEQQPSGTLLADITTTFGSFDAFKAKFDEAAKSCFGSGWAWLCLDQHNKLVVIATQNQDNPITNNMRPILGIDVWEHAYYLKYQNRRADYIAAWWHVINWTAVTQYYQQAL